MKRQDFSWQIGIPNENIHLAKKCITKAVTAEPVVGCGKPPEDPAISK